MIRRLSTTILAAFLLSAPGWAEWLGPPGAAAGQIFTYVAEDAVFLRYAEEEGDLPQGYHVYRRAQGESSWTRLTTNPVEPVFEADRLRAAAGLSAGVLIEMLGGDSGTRRVSKADYDRLLTEPNARNMLMMLTLSYPGLGRALGQEYVDEDVQNGTAFEYRVTALRGGNENEVVVSGLQTHGALTELPVPSGLAVVEEGDGEVYVDWNRDNAVEMQFGLVGYNLYRARDDVGQPFERVNSSPVMNIRVSSQGESQTAFRDEGLRNGTRYWYKLSAVNVFGFEGPPSDPVMAVPRDGSAPPAVGDLGVVVTPGAVLLSWDPVPGDDIRGYRVFRSVGSIDAFEQIAPVRGSALTSTLFVDSLQVGEVLWYQVQAVDNTGNAGPFSNAVQVFEQDVIPPGPVTGLEANAPQAGRVDVNWDSARDARWYQLQRSTHPTQDEDGWMTLGLELQGTGFVDTLWQYQEGEVTYRVRAKDASDNRGPWSEWVTVRPPDRLPPRPPFLRKVTVEGDHLRLEWDRNQEEDTAGYVVWRSLEQQGEFRRVTAQPLADTLTVWRDSGAQPGVVNWYRLSAVDRDGNESERGNPMGTTFYDDVPPPVPGNFQGVADSTGITLTWEASAAGDLEGYRLYRQGENETETVFLRNLPGAALRFRDVDVEPGKTYAYQIAAFDRDYNFSPRSPLVLVLME